MFPDGAVPGKLLDRVMILNELYIQRLSWTCLHFDQYRRTRGVLQQDALDGRLVCAFARCYLVEFPASRRLRYVYLPKAE